MTGRRDWAIASVLRWLGRLLAMLLFLFWGVFFLEHLREWFLNAQDGYPPPRVWAAMVFHLGMLVGLLLMIGRERLGAALTAGATVAFFAVAGFRRVPTIALLNLLPMVCFGLAWALGRSGRDPARSPGGPAIRPTP